MLKMGHLVFEKIFRIFRILLTFQLDRGCFIEYNKNNKPAIYH